MFVFKPGALHSATNTTIKARRAFVSANHPDLLRLKADIANREYQIREARNRELALQVKAALTEMRDAAAAVHAGAQAAAVQSQPAREWQYPNSVATGQPSRNRSIIEKSLGLPGVVPASPRETLDISPITGQPSKLRTMINKSVR